MFRFNRRSVALFTVEGSLRPDSDRNLADCMLVPPYPGNGQQAVHLLFGQEVYVIRFQEPANSMSAETQKGLAVFG